MSNSILFHGQGIADFDHQSFVWGKELHERIIRRPGKFSCPSCNSQDVTATPLDIREIIGLPLGRKRCVFEVQMHRLRCHDCSSYRMENLPFTSSSKTHISKVLERAVIELREHMSISAVANYYGLDWRLVKNLEKAHLKRKYAHISLSEVKHIGVDEIYVGHKKYKTIVRDLDSGSVLHVGDGKGKLALEAFTKRLIRTKTSIDVIAMDMASGYAAWARENLPDATIVFDHFHLIKKMNERLDLVRRRTVNELEENDRKALKKNATCSFVMKKTLKRMSMPT